MLVLLGVVTVLEFDLEGVEMVLLLDLAGAWFGTFFVSVLLVPLLGFRNTLLFAGILKGMALASLVLAALRGMRARG